jgi:hypothetical protein
MLSAAKVFLDASHAAAEPPTNKRLPTEPSIPIEDRPHTIAELDLGIIALPTAPISQSRRGGDVPFVRIGTGDATVLVGLKALARVARELELGAGLRLGPSPTSDEEFGGVTGLARTHSRSYMLFSAEGRYIPYRRKQIEVFVGAIGGLTIVADRYLTNSGPSVPTIFGQRTVTVRSEGLSLGLQTGVLYNLSERWVAGFALRGSVWFLPQTPRCAPIGDCATISGSVVAFEGGLTLGYRVAL